MKFVRTIAGPFVVDKSASANIDGLLADKLDRTPPVLTFLVSRPLIYYNYLASLRKLLAIPWPIPEEGAGHGRDFAIHHWVGACVVFLPLKLQNPPS